MTRTSIFALVFLLCACGGSTGFQQPAPRSVDRPAGLFNAGHSRVSLPDDLAIAEAPRSSMTYEPHSGECLVEVHAARARRQA